MQRVLPQCPEGKLRHVLRSVRRTWRRNPLATAGLLVVTTLLLVAVLAPWIAPWPKDVAGVRPANRLMSPSLTHPFGTDEMGRDILSRVMFGARISLLTGLLVVALALAIGIPLGLLAATGGGWIDDVFMRITDMFLSFPPLLLAMAITATLGPQLENAMLAIAIAWWPWYARLIRAEAISVREREYVVAARATGASWLRIVARHVLANSLGPVTVQASMDLGSVIMTNASLSFLGLGAQPPTPEWGLMVSLGREYFLTNWWVVTFPGLAIFFAVLGFNLAGDGLREFLDPAARRAAEGRL